MLAKNYIRALALAASVSASPIPGATTADVDPVVTLDNGQFSGTTLPSAVNQFLGIPFAAAPVGDLRWKAPVAPPALEGVQSAISVCIPSLNHVKKVVRGSENMY